MQFKTPFFWKKINFISILLIPFSLLYLFCHHLKKIATFKYKSKKKIICIGNFNAGGSGKTPTAISIGKILNEIYKNNNKKPKFTFLSRGYKGKNKNFTEVKKQRPSIVGDEPILLSEIGQTFISKKRIEGIKKIEENDNIDLIVLDDGMQDNSIYKNLTIAVIDATIKFGNQLPLPAGPMRELISTSLKDVDFIVAIGKLPSKFKEKFKNIKIIEAKIKPSNKDEFKDKKLLSFCGIGYPKKFFKYLDEINLEHYHKITFPDHYIYTKKDLAKIIKIAQNENLTIITTKKDWIKIPTKYKKIFNYLDIEVDYTKKDKEFIIDAINKIL